MNFYGHAWVALREPRSRGFVLGAMLPDLAGMARSRLEGVRDPELAAGVALHHRTDAAFHAEPRFARLCACAAAALRERGVARGPSLGAAHVAVELLLDGSLPHDAELAERFAEALAEGALPDVRGALLWRGDGAQRFARLHARLGSRDIPAVYREPARVAERVAWALGSRPRLALDARGERELGGWLAELQPQVEAAAPALVDELAARLWEERG
ncbi:MAG TPA: hypothetical protein VEI82_05775 [Myxococcota bacterium]|nr:hypothetical protein [Myxococcota bacterium]